MEKLNFITVQVTVNKSIESVWERWTNPDDIKQWNVPFDDWHCPFAENDLREGGRFNFRMECESGNEGFDYKGKYDKIIFLESIISTQDDGRKSQVEFYRLGDQQTRITESFEPEDHITVDDQRAFCQSVLDRFKGYMSGSV